MRVLLFSVEGKCYTFGSNQFGQLGYDKDPQDRRPALVKTLSPYKLINVACGDTFSVAVSQGK
jgi:NIMA (never in mitosis gene a)-related kinase